MHSQQQLTLTSLGFTKKEVHKHQPGQEWGDTSSSKDKCSLRIVSHNINKLLLSKKEEKNQRIMKTIQGMDGSDIKLYQEIGINWKTIHQSNNWKSRTNKLKGVIKTKLAHNILDENEKPTQYGGVLVSTNGKPVSWIIQQGEDPSGLGRWAWQRLGHQGHSFVTCISAYFPCKSAGGVKTVWEQHDTVNTDPTLDPRQVLLKELKYFIFEVIERNDSIILGLDANMDVKGKVFTKFMAETGLKM